MSKVLFTSDCHLGHNNIIKYCNRPFTDANHMDAVLIANWNGVVQPDDTVYCLGDFSFGDHSKYLPRLNGKKILIKGNHDRNPSVQDGWSEVHPFGIEIKLDGIKITLCHYKMTVFNKSHHGSLQFYGHSHGTLPGNSQQIDVGVDSANNMGYGYFPLTLEQIQRELNKLQPFAKSDYHGNGD